MVVNRKLCINFWWRPVGIKHILCVLTFPNRTYKALWIYLTKDLVLGITNNWGGQLEPPIRHGIRLLQPWKFY